jgi:hypothetical protein
VTDKNTLVFKSINDFINVFVVDTALKTKSFLSKYV